MNRVAKPRKVRQWHHRIVQVSACLPSAKHHSHQVTQPALPASSPSSPPVFPSVYQSTCLPALFHLPVYLCKMLLMSLDMFSTLSPCRYFIKHMLQENVNLCYRGLGPVAMKALAVPLEVCQAREAACLSLSSFIISLPFWVVQHM